MRIIHRLVLCWIVGLTTVTARAETPTAARRVVLAPGAAKASAGSFASADAIARWINGYRAKPEPQKVPALLHALATLGLLADQETSGLYLGFIGGTLAASPAQASAIVGRMFPLSPDHQGALIKAIAYSGLPGWQDLLRAHAERMPARVVLIDRFVTGRMPALDGLALDAGPVPLDVLWGNYFATGAPEPVFRIISVLRWAKDGDDVERLTIGSMVKWTLATNASRDVDVLAIVKSALAFETKDVQAQLADVLLAAETGETAKIRKDALLAIEQLKAKGPAKTRNAQWWGQAGQMALSLGCVAASVSGAGASVGIPCVIGGAASTAALKMTQPQ